MKSPKTSAPRSEIACARCEKLFFIRGQLVLIKLGERVVPVHPYKRCYSQWEDVFVQQGQISKDGARVMNVGPDE